MLQNHQNENKKSVHTSNFYCLSENNIIIELNFDLFINCPY